MFLSTSPPIVLLYLFVCASIYLTTKSNLSYLFLPFYPSIYVPIYPNTTYLSISVYLSMHLSIHLSIYLYRGWAIQINPQALVKASPKRVVQCCKSVRNPFCGTAWPCGFPVFAIEVVAYFTELSDFLGPRTTEETAVPRYLWGNCGMARPQMNWGSLAKGTINILWQTETRAKRNKRQPLLIV